MHAKILFLGMALCCLAGCGGAGSSTTSSTTSSAGSGAGSSTGLSSSGSRDENAWVSASCASYDGLVSESYFTNKRWSQSQSKGYKKGTKWGEIKGDYGVTITARDVYESELWYFEQQYGFSPAKNPQVLYYEGQTASSTPFVLKDDYVINEDISVRVVYSMEKAFSAGDGAWKNGNEVKYVTLPIDREVTLGDYLSEKPSLANCRFRGFARRDSFGLDSLIEDPIVISSIDYISSLYWTPLCMSSSDGFEVALSGSGSSFPTVYYTKDISEGTTWKKLKQGTAISVSRNESIYFLGDGTKSISGYSSGKYFSFVIKESSAPTGSVSLSGDLSSLMNYEKLKFEDCYAYLFAGNYAIGDAANLILPDEKLTSCCYAYMFYNCKYLRNAPEMSATTLDSGCCAYMFNGCNRLMNAPKLPATSLADLCYYSMFNGCSRLEEAPELPGKELKDHCYAELFKGCTNLKSIKVGFEKWTVASDNSTLSWVEGVGVNGRFYCPSALERITGTNYIPQSWVIDNSL